MLSYAQALSIWLSWLKARLRGWKQWSGDVERTHIRGKGVGVRDGFWERRVRDTPVALFPSHCLELASCSKGLVPSAFHWVLGFH